MQCKDISSASILRFLISLNDQSGTWFDLEYENTVRPLFPKSVSDKFVRAKMNKLIRRGLVEGCICGCRGDYKITEKGRQFLETESK